MRVREAADEPFDFVDEPYRRPYKVPRRRLVFGLWVTLLAVPILALDNVPKPNAKAGEAEVAMGDSALPSQSTARPTSTTAPTPTTAVPAPPTTVAPATTVAPPTTAKPKATTTTTAKPRPTTTTTAKPRPTPTTAAPAALTGPANGANRESGGASWYDWRPGECAHLTIPKGTIVTVTSNASGKSTTCKVTDRGPHLPGRIIDLDRATFAQLADPGAGVIQVTISW